MNNFAYHMYEAAHVALAPGRFGADLARLTLKSPLNPFAKSFLARNIVAGAELFERLTRRYGKPAFDLKTTTINGREFEIEERGVLQKPFCRLLRFERQDGAGLEAQPKLLIVAPMSGHYATLLRGTVEAFLPYYDVYITDWFDAREAPLALGRFDLDVYIDYLLEFCAFLRDFEADVPVHTIGVCQPAVPLMAAIALMEARGDRAVPASMTLMGGPIDTRRSPTTVNLAAQTRGRAWFERNCIYNVPFPNPGMGRRVYPGFLQLSGFMAMNIGRHVGAHLEMFNHLVEGDGDSAERHRGFYDEYLAVMDLDADYFLQTVDTVFVGHLLPRGLMTHRGEAVDLSAIRRAALMTIEGENDDISGIGQTAAAQELCVNIPTDRRVNYLQLGVGHYGVFNGGRFSREVAPRIRQFIAMAGKTSHSTSEAM